jgi:hypothetical protein
LDARDLNALMALFTHDPIVVVIGAGNSHRSVPYSGRYEGTDAVKDFYSRRFSQFVAAPGTLGKSGIRNDCGYQRSPRLQFENWVVITGCIKDHPDISPYKGPFLHVFRFSPDYPLIASLEMFLEPADPIPDSVGGVASLA